VKPEQPKDGNAVFDLSLLPEVEVQFIVMSDTHYILPDNVQIGEWAAVGEFSDRTERALRMAGALPHDFAVHLGDVSHEYPETGRSETAFKGALARFEANRLRFYMAAGNMDIGDKPDPTSPADWADAATLRRWQSVFGPSWYSFDHGDVHGVVLNTQIMDGPLAEARVQHDWVEKDLADHSERRLILFLHMPPYFVQPDERGLGFYNSLGPAPRTWLLGLIRRFRIGLVFAGHTHFVALSREGPSRLYVAPSTATSRAGLAEAFTSRAPDRGRGDVDKLGFFLVRLDREGAGVHLVSTGRDSPASDPSDPRRRVITRLPRELPYGRLGLHASHPLGHYTPGPVIWPSIVRQPVRDDWRLFACLEIGARFLRIPSSDLDAPVERDRVSVLRDEGVEIWPYWIWSESAGVVEDAVSRADRIDGAEIVFPGGILPPATLADDIRRIRKAGIQVSLSTALRVASWASGQGKYHSRTRVGFLPAEIGQLSARLIELDAHVERVGCRLTKLGSLWPAIEAARGLSSPSIGAVDFFLDIPGEDVEENTRLVTEAIAAVATVPGARIVLGPLVDLDRSMDAAFGLLDRLSNPRSTFQVARYLNSLLFGERRPPGLVSSENGSGGRVIELEQGERSLTLILPGGKTAARGRPRLMEPDRSGQRITIYELQSGLSLEAAAMGGISRGLEWTEGPVLVVREQHPERTRQPPRLRRGRSSP